jgi:thiazole synthase ThiGH ThiG subunit
MTFCRLIKLSGAAKVKSKLELKPLTVIAATSGCQPSERAVVSTDLATELGQHLIRNGVFATSSGGVSQLQSLVSEVI